MPFQKQIVICLVEVQCSEAIDIRGSWDFFQVHIPDHLPTLVDVSMLKGQFEKAVDVPNNVDAIGAGFVVRGVAGWEVFEQRFIYSQVSARG